MKRMLATAGVIVSSALVLTAQQPDWAAMSNSYTKRLMDVEMKYTPEAGSEEGLAEYDEPELLRKAVMEEFVPTQ